MKFLFPLLFSIFFLACSSKENECNQPIVFKYQESVDSNRFDVSLIELENTEESMIHSISKLEVYQDFLFIIDNMQSRKVLVFKKTGEFIKQLGANGRGPGEYLHPWSLSIDRKNHHIAVLDYSEKKILYYDIKTMNFIKEMHLPFNATKVEFLDNGNLAWYGSQTDSYVLITDSNMNRLNEFLPRKFNPAIKSGSSIKNLFSNNSEVFFYPPFSTDVYIINSDSAQLKYVFKLGDYEHIKESKLSQFSETNRDYIDYIKNSSGILVFDAYNTPANIYCNFFVNDDSFIAFYNKKSQEGIYFNKEELIETLKLPKFYNPIGTYDDFIVSSINSFDVLSTFKSGGEFNSKIEAQLKRIREDSGFNLLLLKFKH